MKDFFNMRKSKLLLLTLLACFAGGVSPTWADELTENFESLTVDETTLSNGWFVQGGTLKSTVTSITSSSSWGNNAGNSNYELINQGANSTSYSICNYESSNTDKYLIIPIELTGKIKFYAGGCRTSGTRKVEVYKVSYDSETAVYIIGQKIGSTVYPSARLSSSVTPNWLPNKQEVDLGSEHTMVAFLLQGSAIDEVEAEKYVYTPYVEPASLSATTSGESADITWTAGETEETITAWNLEYKKTADDTWTEVHNISASSFTYTISDLNSNTSYDVRVKAVYGENESSWKTTTFKTAKVAVPATGFTDNFETDKGWDFVTVGTSSNSWVRGTATNNGGTAAMYISNDGGTSNAYATSGAMAAYATKLFAFEAGDYTISYDWKANGESIYDYLRVALVPASDELTATYTPIGTSSLPTGWTELDGGSKLNQKTDWQSVSKDITITDAGSYQIVFAWRNDGSGGSNPPAAIDNFKIIGAAPVLELGGDVVGTTLDFGSVAETTNKTVRITNSGKVAMENITLTETADEDDVFAYAALPKTTLDANESMDVTVTFSGSSTKDYTGTFRVSADDCDAIDVTVTATYSNSAAQMAVTLDDAAVDGTVAFGSVGKQAVKTFTVTNDGDQTLNVTIASDNTTDFTVAPAALAVTGHTSETFTVTFIYPTENPVLDSEKTSNITVTPSNEGLTAKTFAVTGTRIEQWSEDFSGNALPDGWETTGSLWSFTGGEAVAKYQYNTNSYLITPSLIVEDQNSALTFQYKANGTSPDIKIYVSKNGSEFTQYGNTISPGTYATEYQTGTITGLEAGNYKIRFNADNYTLDNFEGFKRNMNDPKLGIYSDAECTTAVATSVTKDFGFNTTAPESAVYYIKNDGTGTMTLSLGENPDGITASLDKTSVAAGEHATLTIAMPAEDNKGYHEGNVVVTATDLGTFTVAATGVIVEDGKLNLDFATATIPSTWTASNWTKNASGYMDNSYYSSGTIETTNLIAEAGEEIVIEAKMYTSSYTFGVNYKKIGTDTEWQTLIAAANIGTNWTMLHTSFAEAGTYQLQFVGTRAQIRHIYGLTEPSEPVMVVYDGESVAAATYDFGNASDEADATKVFTVKNEGKAKLTGLAAALSGDDADHYHVEVSATELAVNATATITVKQLKDNIGSHSATLTISATGLDNQVIALSGNTYDHTKLFVDFEDGNLPDGWTKGSYWSVSQVTGNTNRSLGHSYSSSYASSVVTTPLTVAENETLTFGASRYYSSSAPTLKVRYTADGGLTWSEYTDFSSEITSSYSGNTFKELTLTGVPAGTVVLEFYGSYVRLDNIYGFTATTAPLLALTESSTAVENNSTKEFGTLTAEATATYTLTNNGTADMVSTVATTGVATAAISGAGEGVTIAADKVTLAAGKSATITLTLPYETPYGEKTGAMTITTEGWVADFTVNYTATTVDPTALYEDFASNAKPEGWYQETSGWTFTTGTAHIYTGIEKSIITEQYGAESGKNVLTFDAKLQSANANGDLKVYTSTDRKTWTLVKTVTLTGETQTVALDALADGSYYVKFQSLNASIDNLAGLKKLTAPAHDLYVSATTFPTTTLIPETTNGVAATATVYSLRAAEEGVYAKLFFDETAIATAEGKDISKDGSASFTLTGNVPAEEKTYAAKIVVYYSDETVAWETATTDVTVAHTRTLEITDFALTSPDPAEAVADENNQFSATFAVTLQNTGTTALTAEQVSASILLDSADGEVQLTKAADAALAVNGEVTITLTGKVSAGAGGTVNYYAKENLSNTTFATPVSVTATAQTALFAINTDGSTQDFGLVTVNDEAKKSYTVTNSGSKALTVSIAAPEGFSSQTRVIYFTNSQNWSTVNAYFWGEHYTENWPGTAMTWSYTNDYSQAVYAISVPSGATSVIFNNGSETQTVNIDNLNVEGYYLTGDNTDDKLLNVASWGEAAAYGAGTTMTIPAGETGNFNILMNTAAVGKKSGTVTLTTNAADVASFNIPVKGRVIAEGTWTESFDTEIPSNWQTTGWTWNNGRAYSGYTKGYLLTTPRLAANADEELTFDVIFPYSGDQLKVQYSTDRETWTDVATYSSTASSQTFEGSFTAPAAGNYYLRFGDSNSRYVYVDNFVGFRLNPNTLQLNETETPDLAEEFYETITLNRTFAAGWNTVCLPFEISNVTGFFGANAKAYDFTDYTSEGALNFQVTSALEAGKPYIVYVESAINDAIILSNITVSSATASNTVQNKATFQGTYAPMAAGTMTGKYGVTKDAKIAKGTSTASMKGFRAYFELPDGVSARIAFFDEDGTVTYIGGVSVDELTNGTVYNMQGQRITSPNKSGLYIINGKKTVVKKH